MTQLPTGIVTFLFTDIEESTARWERDRDAMSADLALHDRLLRESIEAHSGHVITTAGDGYTVAFSTVAQAAKTAAGAQRDLARAEWMGEPLAVRMGIHAGPAEERDDDFFGPAVNRTARLMAAAAGGQVLVSRAAAELLDGLPEGLSLRPLGDLRLRGVDRAMSVVQLVGPGLPDDFPPLRSMAQTGYLPTDLSSFVGRETEVRAVVEKLEASRLVTLVGVGGVGKSRLAKHAAAAGTAAFPDGVWFVALAPISDADLVSGSVARTLGLQHRLDRGLTEVVLDHLATRTMLLVLDNCEHLRAGVAEFTSSVLSNASQVRILATSRERLAIPGEALFPVPPLGLDGDESDAARLFGERASAIRADFVLDSKTAMVVSRICARLEGIPLAIELAAARLSVLSAGQIEARLDDMFRLLADTAGGGDPRQQTLEATLDWSCRLLDEPARRALRSASVFRGGFTLEASEAVFGEQEDAHVYAVDLLAHLMDASLLTFNPERVRYRILEPVRQFSMALLVESGEDRDTRRCHARYYATALAGSLRRLRGADAEAWAATYDAEQDNARAAIVWAVENDPTLAVSLVSEMAVYWLDAGVHDEARQHLSMILEAPHPVPSKDLALANIVASELASLAGDQEAAVRNASRALAVADEAGDPIAQAHARLRHAHTVWDGGSARRAVDLFRDAVDRLVAADSPTATRALWEFGLRLYFMGRLEDGDGVLAELEESAARFRQPDAVGFVESLRGVGAAYRERGFDEHIRRSVAVRRSLGRKADLVNILRRQVWSAIEVGDLERARLSGEEAVDLAREMGNRPGEAAALITLSRVPLAETDWGDAAGYLRRGIQLIGGWRADDWYMFGTFHCARLAVGRGRFRDSVFLYAVSARIRREVPMALVSSMRAEEKADLDESRGRLGDAAYDRAWREGSEATTAAARELALTVASVERTEAE